MNLSMKYEAILDNSVEQYKSQAQYYDEEIVRKNIEEMREKL